MKLKVFVNISTLGAMTLTSLAWANEPVPAPVRTVAGCTPANYVDGSAENSVKTAGTSYTPKCLRIKAGAKVTIEATQHHPLQALANIDGASNPLAAKLPFTSPVTVTFAQPGQYGYFCDVHGDADGDGMAGAILVDP